MVIAKYTALFMHPPPLGGADAYMFYSVFFCFLFLLFSVRHNDSA